MTDAKHTQVPYRKSYDDDMENFVITTSLPPGQTVGMNWYIAYLANVSPKTSKAEIEANADFIITACNAHDDLVAACEAGLLWILSECEGLTGLVCGEDEIKQLRAALTLAKGETDQPE